MNACDGAFLSLGGRRLGAGEAMVFGAPYVESAQAVVVDKVYKRNIAAGVREASVVVCALCAAPSKRRAAYTVR